MMIQKMDVVRIKLLVLVGLDNHKLYGKYVDGLTYKLCLPHSTD